MTQEEFDRMPLAMRPGQVMAVLGIGNWHELEAVRAARPQIAWKLPGMKQWRYQKKEIAKLARARFR